MTACCLACHRNNFRKSRVSDVSARILARSSVSVSVSMSASWNSSLSQLHAVLSRGRNDHNFHAFIYQRLTLQTSRAFCSRYLCIVKAAFHDTDTDTDILTDSPDTPTSLLGYSRRCRCRCRGMRHKRDKQTDRRTDGRTIGITSKTATNQNGHSQNGHKLDQNGHTKHPKRPQTKMATTKTAT